MDSRVDAEENLTSVPFLSPFPCTSPVSFSSPLPSSKFSRGPREVPEENIVVAVTSTVVQNQQMEGWTPSARKVRLGNEMSKSLGCEQRYNICDERIPPVSVSPSEIPDNACKKADTYLLSSGSTFDSVPSTEVSRSPKTETVSNPPSKGSREVLKGSGNASIKPTEQGSMKNTLLFPVRKFSASLDFLVSDARGSIGSDTKCRNIAESNSSAPSSSSHLTQPTYVNVITDGMASTAVKCRNGGTGSSSTNPSAEVADRLLLLAGRLSEPRSTIIRDAEHHKEENARARRKLEDDKPQMSGFEESDWEGTEKARGSKLQTMVHCEDSNGIGDMPVVELENKEVAHLTYLPRAVEEHLNAEQLLRSDTIRRLLMLSSILSGKCSLSEYDDL